jgi:hypothetical protein
MGRGSSETLGGSFHVWHHQCQQKRSLIKGEKFDCTKKAGHQGLPFLSHLLVKV